MDAIVPRLTTTQGDPLVYTAPYFQEVPLSTVMGPAINDYLNANLPIILPPYIDPAAEAAVQNIGLLRAGDMATGAIRTTRLLATLDDEFATKSYVDTIASAPPGGPFLPLAGGTVTGPTAFGDMVSMTGTQTWASGAFPGTNPAIYQFLTYSGTPTAGFPGPEGTTAPANLIAFAESLNYTINPGGVTALEISHATTGGNGGRNAFLVTHGVSGTMGTTNTNYCAAQIFSVYGANVTGAAAGAGNGRGDVFGLGVQMQIYSGSFLGGSYGIELDINPHSGASVDYLVGQQIINFGVTGQLANVFDCMHLLATSNPATMKLATYGYYFGHPQAGDGNGFPITSTGTMIGSRTGTAGIGIDFSAVTFGTALIRGPNNFKVENSNRVSTDAILTPSGTLAVEDAGGNPVLGVVAHATPANYIDIANAAAGAGPRIVAVGSDANVNLILSGQNSGGVVFNSVVAPLAVVDAVDTTGFTNLMTLQEPGLAATGWCMMRIGKDFATNFYSGYIGYSFAATASQSALHIGMYGQASEQLMLLGDGSLTIGASKLGFFSAAPVVKPTVSGAKGSNAALASLMTALAAYGLVTDSTTA
jgi:hypothetical protein